MVAERGITYVVVSVTNLAHDGSYYTFFTEVDGIEYDNLFIFDEVGWNFEPCEISAAFGNVQLKKLPRNLARRQRNFDILSAFFGTYPDVFVLPRQLDELETGWHMFPVVINAGSGIRRSEFQQWMDSHGVDTRMVWTGNAVRQPAFRDKPHRQPERGSSEASCCLIILPRWVASSFPQVTRVYSRSARRPPNLVHDLAGLRPQAQDSQRDRLAVKV